MIYTQVFVCGRANNLLFSSLNVNATGGSAILSLPQSVPEPATMTLLGAGLLGLGLARRRA